MNWKKSIFFLVMAAMLSLVCGDQIIGYYLSTFVHVH